MKTTLSRWTRRMMKLAHVRITLAMACIGLFTLGGSPARVSAELTSPEAVAQVSYQLLNTYWTEVFAAWNLSHRQPGLYEWYNTPDKPGSVMMPGCGEATVNNSWYCPANEGIYLDYAFHTALVRNTGDYASGLIIGHEWGHHIQQQLGLTDAKARGAITNIAFELQADCFTGAYTRYGVGQGVIEGDDLANAGAILSLIGDAERNSNGHGTAADRQAWFMYGYNTGNPGVCEPYKYGW